jgi:peptidyl-prolyl cis-trans isomerase SurA
LESEFASCARAGEWRAHARAGLHGLHPVRPPDEARTAHAAGKSFRLITFARNALLPHTTSARPPSSHSEGEPTVKRILVAVGVLAAAGFAQGCRKDSAPAPDVWAVVNGHEIKKDEVDKYYRSTATSENPNPSQEEALSMKLSVLDELINNEILIELAQKEGLAATDGEVEDKFTEEKSPYTEEEFQRQLKDRGLTVDDLKQEIRRSLTIQKLFNREVESKISITDQDITDYFNQNRAQFNVSETEYRIAQIVITPKKDPQIRNRKNDDATTDAEAKRKAAAITEKLDTGADFGTLAADYSEDPTTTATGGDVGYVPESALDKADPLLKKTVLSLRPGQVSGVIQLHDGTYYIIKLLAKEPPGQRELSDPQVQQTIRDALRGRKDQLLRAAFLTVARGNAKVTNYLAQQVLESAGKLPAVATPTASQPPGQ